MNKYLRCILFSFLLFTCSFSAHAQQWAWGAKGGGAGSASTPYNDDDCRDMATDANGNIYILSTVKTPMLNANDIALTGYGELDAMLSSFDCHGVHRWSKVFGAPSNDNGLSLALDSKEGVYVAIQFNLYSTTQDAHLSTDVTIPNNNKEFYLVKYDTAGVYQWHRAPQPDTVTSWGGRRTGAHFMAVDAQDNLHMFCSLPKGQYGGSAGYFANDYAQHMLKYDANGNCIGGVKMDMDIFGNTADVAMRYNKRNGLYYIAGVWYSTSGPVRIGNKQLTGDGGTYLSCFNSAGQLVWLKENTGDVGIAPEIAIDDKSNIYVTGGVKSGSFGGYTFNSAGIHGRPMVMKLDSLGNAIWASSSDKTDGSMGGACIALRNSGEVVLAGAGGGNFSWPGYPVTFVSPVSGRYQPFIARFNTQTGKILGIDTLSNLSGNAEPQMILPDGKNSVYMGGFFIGKIKIGNNNLYKTGGGSDWYIGRYGYDCGCKEVPEPKFSYSQTSNTDAAFSYTGTAYSSIEWDFGDGGTSTQASPNHTFPYNSYQTVCVKVTNQCGDNIYCENVPMWPLDVNNLSNSDGISIYPNPANDLLTIDHATKGTQIQLQDMMGRVMYKTVLQSGKGQLNIANYPAGNYLIQLVDANGNRVMKQVVKK